MVFPVIVVTVLLGVFKILLCLRCLPEAGVGLLRRFVSISKTKTSKTSKPLKAMLHGTIRNDYF